MVCTSAPRRAGVFCGGALPVDAYHPLYLPEPTPGAAMVYRFGDDLASEMVQPPKRKFRGERHGEPMCHDAMSTARIIGDGRSVTPSATSARDQGTPKPKR